MPALSSSPVTFVDDHPGSSRAAVGNRDGDSVIPGGLLALLAQVADPRRRRGVRHTASSIVAVASNLSSLREQSPVIYRGLQVGEVQRYQLSSTGDEMVIEAMVHEEYAPLVRMSSKFWNAGGINFKVGLLRGAEITAESPQTLLSGAIEFATPPETSPTCWPGCVSAPASW